jgi:hypothetical protein
MHFAAILFGVAFLAGVLLDAFQTIILPRRPVGRFRITWIFFLVTWTPWAAMARLARTSKAREQMYSVYGPLALLLLFVLWALLLAAAYALIYFGMHTPFSDPTHPVGALARLRSCLYVSGTTLFTLGLGDVQPASHVARMFVVLEAGTGLGFVALVIGYVPVLYGAFSAREIPVAMLDARAGSPPTAGELLLRHSFRGGNEAMTLLLAEWERWCAGMLETHISYPILCYYRSQHDNQSWLSALTAVLDACALLITVVEGPSTRQAQLTFAIGRHTLVDIGHVFQQEKNEQYLRENLPERLDDETYSRLCDVIGQAGFKLCGDLEARDRLRAIRALYEPHAFAMAQFLRLDLPKWAPAPPNMMGKKDQWAKVAELRSPAGRADRLSDQLNERLNQHVSLQSTASHLQDEHERRS